LAIAASWPSTLIRATFTDYLRATMLAQHSTSAFQ
jgi:hypothetical protein